MSDWKARLTGGAQDNRARSGLAGDLVDVSPLPEPVNAFGFAAELIKSGPRPTDARDLELWQMQVAWLEDVAGRIPYETKHPVVALAVARMALVAEERAKVAAVIEGLEELLAQYTQGAQGG